MSLTKASRVALALGCALTALPGGVADEAAATTEHSLGRILAEPQHVAEPTVLAKLRPADTAKLLREYRRLGLPSKRAGITLALGYAGGEGAFQALTNCLTLEFQDRTLPDQEAFVLEGALDAIGFLGQEDDRAFAFLLAAIRAETWERIRRWRYADPGTERDASGILVTVSIQALGLTGREEVGALLRKLRQENYRVTYKNGSYRTVQAALMTAAFRLETCRAMGKQEFRAKIYGRSGEELRQRWHRSPSGLDWYRWVNPPEKAPDMWGPDGFPRVLRLR